MCLFCLHRVFVAALGLSLVVRGRGYDPLRVGVPRCCSVQASNLVASLVAEYGL